MMYSNKLVCCVKANGKVLREFKDEVYIPYGTEYSLYFKNLNSVRASVDITLDGRSVMSNGSLVINPNSEVTVERFVTNNEEGNRFKFIERSGKVEEVRGVKAEDGLIRVSFRFERVFQPVLPTPQPWVQHHHHYPASPIYGNSILRGAIGGSSAMSLNSVSPSAGASASGQHVNSGKVTAQNLSANHPLQNDVGITVEGSKSDQKFTTVSWFPTEPTEHVIVLKLLGDIGQNKVEKAVTVKAKLKCKTCGTSNKASSKFCKECGTAVGAELVTQ